MNYAVINYWEDGYASGDNFADLYSDVQSVTPSAIIELFEIELNIDQHGVNDIYRFHAGVNLSDGGEVVWAGNSYLRFPVEAEGFEYNGNGQLPRPKIRVSNILGTITAVMAGLPSGIEGAKVTRIRTLVRYLDAVNFPSSVNPYGDPDPTAEFPREIYYIDRKSTETRDVIEFELAAAFDLAGVRAPKRQCIANICQWKYRSAECGYTGTAYYKSDDTPTLIAGEDVCGKRLSSCETRFTPLNAVGSVTLGSTTLTLSSTSSVQSGDPVAGFGVPEGTTVSLIINETSLTMSAAAIASTSVTVSGTPSATASSMVVTSTTGLGIGRLVEGPNIGPGTTISGISGNTLTLNQRPYSIYRQATFVYVSPLLGSSYLIINTSGLSQGMKVFGSNNINTTISSIVSLSRITLNNYGNLSSKDASVDLYFIPASPVQSTYFFTGSTSYVFRSADNALPFGSFPGVGTYFS